ncbi:MAG TPA: hypothetical protein VJO14_02250 [Bacteroidota bacterium]|nr:hypothetical protein [Bacteroidota bacterium]
MLVHKVLLLMRSVGFVIEPYYFYQEGPFRSVPSGKFVDFTFMELGVESHSAIAELYPVPPSRGELRARFNEGQKCFALKRGERIAALSWCETVQIGFEPCRRPLEKYEAYLFGAETLFEFRGRRLQPYLRCRCYEALEADGRSLLYSYSDYFNYPARRFKERLGARILFTGLNLRLFGLWKKNWILRKRAEVKSIPSPEGKK